MTYKLTIITISFMSPCELKLTYGGININDPEVEWLVVDGGGCSETKQFLQTLPSSTLWISESDKGIYDAMRKGLARASGEYILFLNSGDELTSWDVLKNTLRQAYDFDVLFAAATYSINGLNLFTRFPRNPYFYIYHSVPGNQQATIYKRDLLLNIGLPTNYPLCGDYALACKLFCKRAKMGTSNNIVSKFYLGGASTVHWWRLILEAWAIQRNILNLSYFFCGVSFIVRFINIWGLKTVQFLKKIRINGISNIT